MTPDEIKQFKKDYGTHTDDELAMKFILNLRAVQELATKFALGKDKRCFDIERMPRWTAKEKSHLLFNYSHTSNEEIGRYLGRTVKSVVAKAHKLGLKKDASRLREMGKTNVKLRRDRL